MRRTRPAFRSRCQRCGAAAGWISVAGNVLLAGTKWAAGLLCGSQALLADALHSSVDVIGSVVTLVMLKLSRRGATRRYPYGLGKLEDLSAMGIYLVLVAAGVFMTVEALHSIVTGDVSTPALPALLAALLSIGVNLGMYYFISCAGRHTNSPSLVALGYENRVDALSSVAATVGIIGAMAGFTPLDPAAAIVVSSIIVVESMRELWQAARSLTDAALPLEVRRQIARVAASVPHVAGVRSVKTRRIGPAAQVDVDVLVDALLSVETAAMIAREVKERLREAIDKLGEVHVYTHASQQDESIRASRLAELIQITRELRTRRQE